jgi:hypothetical protein
MNLQKQIEIDNEYLYLCWLKKGKVDMAVQNRINYNLERVYEMNLNFLKTNKQLN